MVFIADEFNSYQFFLKVSGLYPPHEIILKISNNLSMNLKKIINNIDFIIKNE